MKRDWNLIRELLLMIEEDRDLRTYISNKPKQGNQIREEYEHQLKEFRANELKFWGHLELLNENRFIDGIDVRRGPNNDPLYSISHPRLTMTGHDLLDTMRSSSIWESIKSTAKAKSIELTFDAIKSLAILALNQVIGT